MARIALDIDSTLHHHRDLLEAAAERRCDPVRCARERALITPSGGSGR